MCSYVLYDFLLRELNDLRQFAKLRNSLGGNRRLLVGKHRSSRSMSVGTLF